MKFIFKNEISYKNIYKKSAKEIEAEIKDLKNFIGKMKSLKNQAKSIYSSTRWRLLEDTLNKAIDEVLSLADVRLREQEDDYQKAKK